MAGEHAEPPCRFRVPGLSELNKRLGRVEFQRGVLRTDDTGRLVVYRAGRQGSGILSSMSTANCFIVLPEDADSVAPETLVEVEPFEGLVR
jgi:molybdopterin molybdotransferase